MSNNHPRLPTLLILFRENWQGNLAKHRVQSILNLLSYHSVPQTTSIT